MGVAWDILSLVVCIGLPFGLTIAKRHLVHTNETQLFDFPERTNGQAGAAPLWKPHKKLRYVWAVIYVLMGLAAWRVARRPRIATFDALFAYAALLFAKALAWPPLFFGGYPLYRPLLESAGLGVATAYTVVTFQKVDTTATYMLIPFIAYTCYATVLINFSCTARPEVMEKAAHWSGLRRSKPAHEQNAQHVPLSPPSATSLRYRQATTPQPNLATPVTTKPTVLLPATEISSFRTVSRRGGRGPSEEGEAISPTTLNRLGTLLNRMSDQVRVTGVSGLSQTGVLLKNLSTKMSGMVSHGPLSPASQPVAPPLPKMPTSPTSDSIPLKFFSCPGSAGFKVRGRNYLQDKQKWIPPSPDFTLFAMDLLAVPEPTYHIARYLPSVRDSRLPFHFLWQVMVPGRENISLTISWVLDHDPIAAVKATLAGGKPGERFSTAHEEVEGSDRSFDSVATDSGAAGSRGDSGRGVERSTHSSSGADGGAGTLKGSHHHGSATQLVDSDGTPVTPVTRPRHRRATTQLDGAQTPQKAAPPTGGWWGSTATSAVKPGAARTPEDAEKYAACQPLDVALMRFLEAAGEAATDEENARERHSQFKIIPRVEEGGWIVKSAVGQNTPVLLGRKITTKYFRGPNYIEVDVDVSSSKSAAHVVNLVQGALKSLVIDIAVLLEGRFPEELPEKLLGTVRLQHLDLSAAGVLDLSTGVITRKPE